jgi:hypothetical protein
MISDHGLALIAARAYSVPATFSIGDAHVLVVTDADPDAVIIAFRGTDPACLLDVVADLRAAPSHDADLGWLHGGFLWDIHCAFDRVIAAIGGRPVILTGHSKGAAEATGTAAKLKARGVPVLKLTVFGCPRMGFEALGCQGLLNQVAKIPGTSYRHGRDPVTEVPGLLVPARPNVPIGETVNSIDKIPDHAMDRYIAALAALPATA